MFAEAANLDLVLLRSINFSISGHASANCDNKAKAFMPFSFKIAVLFIKICKKSANSLLLPQQGLTGLNRAILSSVSLYEPNILYRR